MRLPSLPGTRFLGHGGDRHGLGVVEVEARSYCQLCGATAPACALEANSTGSVAGAEAGGWHGMFGHFSKPQDSLVIGALCGGGCTGVQGISLEPLPHSLGSAEADPNVCFDPISSVLGVNSCSRELARLHPVTML